MGGEITAIETYQAGDQDFSAQLTTIRSSEPDVVFVPGYYTDVGNIALQARKLGITVPLLGRRRLGFVEAGRDRRQGDRRLLLFESLFAPGSEPARAGVHQEVQGQVRRDAGRPGGAGL